MQIRLVNFSEAIVALNPINQHQTEKSSFMRIKIPKRSKSYLFCYKWKE